MSPSTNAYEATTKQQQQQQQTKKDSEQEIRELQQLWKELGISSSSLETQKTDITLNHNKRQHVTTPSTSAAFNTSTTSSTSVWKPIVCLGFGTAVLFNIGILCSLPPVLRGRGTFC